MRQVMIRYRVKPDRIDENVSLVRDVYAALTRVAIPGFRYATIRLDGGSTFVHVLVSRGDEDALGELPAFQRFRSGLDDRLESGPERSEWELVGAYGFD